MRPVMKLWIFSLPFRMQSVLMSALRGCDVAKKHDCSKFITRALRAVCLNNADPTNTFIVGDGTPAEKFAKEFIADVDSYPLHFMMHTIHAAEIVGAKHPEEHLRHYWTWLYKELVKGLHLNPETVDQLDVRLGFTPDELKVQAQQPSEADERFGDWADAPQPIAAPVVKAPPKPPAKRKKRLTARTAATETWNKGTGTSHNNKGY